MFVLKCILRSIFRRKGRNSITLMVSAALTMLVLIYMQNMFVMRNKIDELYDKIPVTGKFTNLTEGDNNPLLIPEFPITLIEESGFVKEEHLSANVRYSIMTGGIWITGENTYDLPIITGITSLECIKGYDMNIIKIEPVGMVDTAKFKEQSNVCIVSKQFLEKYRLKLGDIIETDIYNTSERQLKDKNPNDREQRDAYLELEIIGTYEDITSAQETNIIYCPYYTIKEALNSRGQSLNLFAAGFIIGNTKRISEFKELVTGPSFNDKKNGISFLLNDKSLTAAVSPVEKSLGIMEIMFPYVYVVIIFISFSVSYILMHNRKKEMAMMMSIGEGKGHVLAVTALESLMICAAGSIVGLAVFSICFKYQALSLLISNNAIICITAYIAASMIGSILCTILLIRLDVIKMLSMGE